MGLADADFALNGRLDVDARGRSTLECLTHEPRLENLAAIGKGRGVQRELEWRRQEEPLADRHVDGVSDRPPRTLEGARSPFGVRHHTGGFGWQLDARLLTKPKALGQVLLDQLDAESLEIVLLAQRICRNILVPVVQIFA